MTGAPFKDVAVEHYPPSVDYLPHEPYRHVELDLLDGFRDVKRWAAEEGLEGAIRPELWYQPADSMDQGPLCIPLELRTTEHRDAAVRTCWQHHGPAAWEAMLVDSGSTLTTNMRYPGAVTGMVVLYALDPTGRPVFSIPHPLPVLRSPGRLGDALEDPLGPALIGGRWSWQR